MLQLREIRAAALGAGIVTVYALVVLLSGRVDLWQFARLLSFDLFGSMVLWLAIGVVLMIAQLCRQARRSGREAFLWAFVSGWISTRWERDRFVSLLWPPLLFALLMAAFNAFKQMILPSAGFGFDPMLRDADRLLFLGHDPWRVTHAVLGSPTATQFIDRAYHGWFVPMSLGLIICAWMPASTYRLRTQYVLSYIAIWIGIGSILAYLLPSAGPCFYSQLIGPEPSYDELLRRLAETEQANGARLSASVFQSLLLRSHEGGSLALGGGISAMPSVHNALAALFAIAAFRLNRAAGCVLALYAAVIWIGSIHLGWHYALDGIVAIALTFCIWPVCGRIADALEGAGFGARGVRPAIA